MWAQNRNLSSRGVGKKKKLMQALKKGLWLWLEEERQVDVPQRMRLPMGTLRGRAQNQLNESSLGAGSQG